jgi:hypothetical protein
MSMENSKPGEPSDPIDAYDSQHGKMDNGIPKVSEEQAWGGPLNPVRENHTSYKNLKDVGR